MCRIGIPAVGNNETTYFHNVALNLENVNLTANGTAESDYGIVCNGMSTEIAISLKGGSVTATNSIGVYFPPASSTLTIDGTEITGTTGVAVKGGTVDILGGAKITGKGKKNPPAEVSSGVTNTGDALYVEGNYVRAISVNVKNSTFVSLNSKAVQMLEVGTAGETKDVTITGGQFSSDVKEYIKQDYDQLVTETGETPYIVGYYATDGAAASAMNSNVYKLSLPSGVDVYYMSEQAAQDAVASAPNGTFTSTTPTLVPKPASTSSNDSSDSRANANFWEDVEEEIRDAASGEIVKVDARSFDRMPESVMEALRENPGVSLVVEWNGGETITIPAGEARSPEAGRIYYPLSLLVELYDGSTLTNPETGGVLDPALLNPETGGVHVVTAPETPIQEEVTITPSTEGVTEGTTGTAPSVGEAGESETAGPVQAPKKAEESGGAGGVAIAFVVLALAGGAILWLMLRRDKNTRG